MYERLGMNEKAQEYLDFANKMTTETLDYYANEERYFPKHHSYLLSMSMLASYYSRHPDEAKRKEAENITRMYQDYASA